MEDIVFYIHRTGLLGYFVNPICSFLKNKYRITVLHLDKRNGYSSKRNEDYRSIDISDYSIESIRQTLREINPKAVILVGFISIYELLMLRIATDLQFKTIYLEHGIYSKNISSLPWKKLITQFWSTLTKNLFFLRQYGIFIKHASNPKLEASLFKQCVMKKDYRNNKFSKALFLSDYGYKKIDKFFQYDKKDVDFTCYPLVYDNAEFKEFERIARMPLSENKKAIWIHQPFIQDGLVTWEYDAEKDYIADMAKNISKYGYELTLLIHPRESKDRYEKLYKNSNINIEQNINPQKYKDYALVIGHYSTALLYPVFLHIPILIVDYGKKIRATDSLFYPLSCHLPVVDFSQTKQIYTIFRRRYIGMSNCSFENAAYVLDKNIISL